MNTSTLPTISEAAPATAGASPAPATAGASGSPAPLFPTETEIYLLPDGRVVVADLPAELAATLAQVGSVEPCAATHVDDAPSAQP